MVNPNDAGWPECVYRVKQVQGATATDIASADWSKTSQDLATASFKVP